MINSTVIKSSNSAQELEEVSRLNETEKTYKIKDLASSNSSFPKLEKHDFKELKFNDQTVSLNRQFIVSINTDNSNDEFGISLPLKDFKEELFLPLANSAKNNFFLTVDTGSYECEGIIRYSSKFNRFIVIQLKIYTYKAPLDTWISKLSSLEAGIKTRIDYLLSEFGLNPDGLLYMEKIAFLLRLVPLVVKKYLMIDISKKEIGKTYIFSQLGFNLYTNCITRSSSFIDGRNGKEGDFFSEKIAYIIDEVGKVNDPEVITSIQVYKNGDDDYSTLQAGKENKKSSNSIILLGNPKINVEFNRIFETKTNLFRNTIIDKNEDSSAFLSRVDSMIPSYGCRTFNSTMLNEKGTNVDFLKLVKTVIPVLREEEIDISSLKTKIPITFSSPRDERAILKTLKGLLKLLYPEILAGEDIDCKIINFLLLIAVQARETVNNQIAIIDNNTNNSPYSHSSSLRNLYFNFNYCYYTPHFVLRSLDGLYWQAIPFDTIGIEQCNNYGINNVYLHTQQVYYLLQYM